MFNENIKSLKPSRSMVLMAKAKQMKAMDPEIIDLAGGEPDFDTPERIRAELIHWINQGYTHYTVGPGLPELRTRIAKKLNEENNCTYSPDGIIVTPGGKYAVYAAVRSIVNSGDEVIYLNPGWVSYPSIIEASGAIPVALNLDYKNDYKITLEVLEKNTSARTRMIIINYPNNPTGKVLHADELDILKTYLLAHPDVFLLSDEIYERIAFDGILNISPASVPEIADRVITINGFSKSVAMTGWRIGYLAASPEVASVIHKLFQHTITCVSGFIQKTAVIALDCTEEIETMRQRYEARRNMFIDELNAIPKVHCTLPEGAFYAWVRFDIPGMDSEQVCQFILEKAKVVGVPGISYGEENAAFMRFSFAASEDALMQAAANIKKAIAQI